jgi:hypothetical protein
MRRLSPCSGHVVRLEFEGSSASGARRLVDVAGTKHDVADVWRLGCGLAAPVASFVGFDLPLATEVGGDVVGHDVGGRIERVVAVVGEVEFVVDDQQRATGGDARHNSRIAVDSVSRGRTPYWTDTRSKVFSSPASSINPPCCHVTVISIKAAADAARSRATADGSRAVTFHPRCASQIASAPSPQPTSNAVPGSRSATSTTRLPFGSPDHRGAPSPLVA